MLRLFLPLVKWLEWFCFLTDKLNQFHTNSVQGPFCGRCCFCGLKICVFAAQTLWQAASRDLFFSAGAQKVITDMTTPSQRADALGKLGLCFGIGIIVGSVLGGVLSTKFGWVPHLFSVGLVATIEGAAKGYFASSSAFDGILLLVAIEDHTRTQNFAFCTATKSYFHGF